MRLAAWVFATSVKRSALLLQAGYPRIWDDKSAARWLVAAAQTTPGLPQQAKYMAGQTSLAGTIPAYMVVDGKAAHTGEAAGRRQTARSRPLEGPRA